MFSNNFLKNNNENKEMNGDYMYEPETFKYKNTNGKTIVIDKIILTIVNYKSAHKINTFGNIVLENGFNIKIGDNYFFDDDIKCVDDIFSYDCKYEFIECRRAYIIEKYIFNIQGYELKNNDEISVTLKDDFTNLDKQNILVKCFIEN